MGDEQNDILNKVKFRSQRLYYTVISEIKIKKILEKIDNGQELNKMDYNVITNFADKVNKLQTSKNEMLLRRKSSRPYLLDSELWPIAAFISFVIPSSVGYLAGSLLKDYAYDKCMEQNSAVVQNLMDMTSTTNIVSLQTYLESHLQNVDMLHAYNTLTSIFMSAEQASVSLFDKCVIAGGIVGVAIPTSVYMYNFFRQTYSNLINDFNNKIVDMEENRNKVIDLLNVSKEKFSKPPSKKTLTENPIGQKIVGHFIDKQEDENNIKGKDENNDNIKGISDSKQTNTSNVKDKNDGETVEVKSDNIEGKNNKVEVNNIFNSI